MGDMKKFRARKIYSDKLMTDDYGLIDKKIERKIMGEDCKDKVRKVEKVVKTSKKIKPKKIRMSMTKAEEKKLDKELEMDNNISTAFLLAILVLCFVAGIFLGYVLYKIALFGAV